MAKNKSINKAKKENAGSQMGKAKEFKKTAKTMLSYGKKYKVIVIFAVLFAIAGTILNLIGPNIIGDITNLITGSIDKVTMTVHQIPMSKIWKLVGIMICLNTLGFILTYAQTFMMSYVTEQYCKKMRTDICNKLNRVPLNYFDKTTYGDILSRVTNDVDNVGENMNRSVASLVTNIVMLIGSLIMMIIKSWILTIPVLLITILGFLSMMVIMIKSQKHFIAQQKFMGELNGHIEESYSSHQVINVYNAQDEINAKFKKLNDNLYSSGWKSQFISGLMQPIMSFVGNFGYCVICALGVILAWKGKMSFGDITAFMIYIRLFLNPLSQIAQAFTSMQTMVASGERVFDFLSEKELEDESHKTLVLTDIKGDVEFKDVKFGYADDHEIIHGFSAKIKAGEKIAIVGKTGAGKSTLVNLLMRFYEINSGEICVDGVNIQNLTREQVHNMFSMVLQDSWMFEASVKDNLRFNNPNVTDEEIENVCKECGVHNFIKTLPQGYDTVLNDDTNISAGQKQLLTIARAMLQNNPMLILDEATSSVDTRTELLIQKAMDKLMEKRTSFVIAHRLSTIQNADEIFVIDEGDIIEKGNHNELMSLNGSYAKLYSSQFEEV